MTCILVTHEMGFAREIADHIYFTDRGVIVEHGPPATFFKEAKAPRTREFLSKISCALPLLLRGWIGRVGAKHYRPPAREGSLRHAAITSRSEEIRGGKEGVGQCISRW